GLHLLFYTKFISRFRLKCLSRLKYNGWELWLIRAVGIMLCLKAECGSGRIRASGFSNVFSGKKIAGIELYARLRCQNFQADTRSRGISRSSDLGNRLAVYKRMVISIPAL